MSKLGLVIFGASVYDNHSELNNHRFANSAKEFEAVCIDQTIVPNSKVTVLNLFDTPQLPSETITGILDFVNEDYETVIIYYCGHGDVSKRKDEYFVFLRASRRDRRNATLLNIPSLILDVERISSGKKIYFVLDACYSGDVISQMKEFMDAGAAASLYENPFEDLSNSSGIAVFAATRGSDVALAKKEDPVTLFTGNFVGGLKRGIAYRAEQPSLSWLDIRDYIVRATYERLGADAPIPKIVSLDDKYADITRVPFFTNLAYVAPSARTKSVRKQRRIISQEESEYYFWSRIPDYANAEIYDDFLRKFPNGTYNLVALALLKAKLEQKNHDELTQFIADSPHSQGSTFAKARLEELRWHQLRQTEDILALETFAKSAVNKGVVEEARRRIDELKSPSIDESPLAALGQLGNIWSSASAKIWSSAIVAIGLAAAIVLWGINFPNGREVPQNDQLRQELAAIGNDIAKLTAFVARCQARSECPVLGEAREKLAQIERERQAAQFRADLQAAGTDVEKLAAFIFRCQGFPSCPVAAEAQQRLQAERTRLNETAQFRSDLQVAGNDPARLTAFITRCQGSSNCPVLAEAREKLAAQTERDRQVAQFRADLQAAGNDPARLTAFITRCQGSSNCQVLAEAREKFAAQAERERQAAQFRSDLQTAGSDPVRLTALITRCQGSSNCPVLTEAREKLAAQAERERQAAQFRSDLQAAGNDATMLAAFVTRCGGAPNCPVLAEAQQRLQIVQYHKELQAAGTDPIKLAAFIGRCQLSPHCLGLSEAQQRLQTERTRQISLAAPTSFVAYANEDLNSVGTPLQTLENTDLAKCVDACRGAAGCVAYTFDKWNRTCFLKSNFTTIQLEPKGDSGIRKDQKAPIRVSEDTRACRYPKTVFTGDIIRSVAKDSWEICKSECDKEKSCIAYTFVTPQKTCKILSNPTDRTKDDRGESGIKAQRPKGSWLCD